MKVFLALIFTVTTLQGAIAGCKKECGEDYKYCIEEYQTGEFWGDFRDDYVQGKGREYREAKKIGMNECKEAKAICIYECREGLIQRVN